MTRVCPSPKRERGVFATATTLACAWGSDKARRRLVGAALAVFSLLLAAQTAPQPTPHESPIGPHFVAVDVFIDCGATPLAAYQFELSAAKGEIQIVGVEGGEHPAFAEPPYYDPVALQHERIIIAAFNTGATTALPTGKTRVARVHLRAAGDAAPEYKTFLKVAADRDGQSIDATASIRDAVQPGDRK